MALLTEEQIEQLVKIASVTSTVKSYHDKFCEWNEKQTAQQIEIDWSKAPTAATSAILRLVWVVEESWSVGYQIAKYDRPAPVITPHPHAAIMAKYAEVAARRVDPWVEFERYNYLNNTWEDKLDDHPSWRPKARYRHIGDDK